MMNNKYQNPIIFLSVMWLMACNHNSTNIAPNDDYMELNDVYAGVKTYNLEPIDTIYSFASEYPVGIEAAGNKLFLTLAMQDTAICVIDPNTGTKLKVMGHKGSGPDDVISPGFFYNRCISADSCLLIEDINARKLIGISINDLSMRKESLPHALYDQSSINYDGDNYVAYKITGADYLFSIGCKSIDGETRVAYPFLLSETGRNALKSHHTLLAPNINANFEKKRIIVSMYFFDAYYVYDFDGNKIGEYHLHDSDFDINTGLDRYLQLDSDGIIRYTRGYGTDEYCYLRRLRQIPDKDQSRYITISTDIVKTDWNGNPIAVIKVPDGFKAFCVDDNGDITGIVNTRLSDITEHFDIIRFKQNLK